MTSISFKSLSILSTSFIAAALVFGAATTLHGQAKPTLTGLVAMGEINGTKTVGWIPDNGLEEPLAHLNTYNAVDVNVTWAQLEPSEGTFDFSAITSAAQAIMTYNTNHPTRPMKAKLRVYAGVNSPTWVLNLSSTYNGQTYYGPVTVYDTSNDPPTPISVPLFWTYEYHQKWQALQNALAASYDGNALLAEVSVSSCSSISGEPFNDPIHNTDALANMHADGYNDAQIEACYGYAAANDSTGDYHAFTKTPLYFAFSPFDLSDGVTSPGKETLDFQEVSNTMKAFRTNFGSRAVLGNNALADPFASSEDDVYNGANGYNVQDTVAPGIHDLGQPIGFQAVSGSPTGGWPGTVTTEARGNYDATEMEIWQTTAAVNQDGKKGYASITQAQLTTFAGEAW